MPEHRHFIIHKPFGYLSQFVNNQTNRRNKKLLGALGTFPEGTMSIGRLDEHSEGLLLLTTDGKVSRQVTSKHVEKEYYVQVDGLIDEASVERLRAGVTIRVGKLSYDTLPCQSNRLEVAPQLPARAKKIRDERHGPTSWLSITLKEGKYRQVRKMTAVVGFPTLRLVRVRVGHLLLNDMTAGEIIEVDDFGIAYDI